MRRSKTLTTFFYLILPTKQEENKQTRTWRSILVLQPIHENYFRIVFPKTSLIWQSSVSPEKFMKLEGNAGVLKNKYSISTTQQAVSKRTRSYNMFTCLGMQSSLPYKGLFPPWNVTFTCYNVISVAIDCCKSCHNDIWPSSWNGMQSEH